MEPNDFLNQFRKDWQQELSSKHDSNCEDFRQASANNGTPEQLALEVENSDKNVFATNKNQDNSHSCESAIDHCLSCSKEAEKSGVKSLTSDSTDKRKCKEKNKHTSKKTKQSRFDDIFSEKERGVLPQERLLDRLIQDIVSSACGACQVGLQILGR